MRQTLPSRHMAKHAHLSSDSFQHHYAYAKSNYHLLINTIPSTSTLSTNTNTLAEVHRVAIYKRNLDHICSLCSDADAGD